MSEGQPLSPNLFKRNLAAGKRQIGLWLSLNSVMSTEICAGSGYDWLLLDMEHAAIDVSQVLDHLRAAKGGTAELMVRLPWNDPIIMKRLLDAGVRNFMIPMVQSAAEARAQLEAVVEDGGALKKFREMVAAQGGDAAPGDPEVGLTPVTCSVFTSN